MSRNLLQVVRACPFNRDPASIERARPLVLGTVFQHPNRPCHNLNLARKILPRDARRIGHNLSRRSIGDQIAAVFPRPRAQVEHVIRFTNRVLIVFDNEHRIAQITQRLKCCNEPLIIPLVQPDRRLVQHIKHSPQPASNLRRKPNPLALATRQSSCRAIQRKIPQPHGIQKLQPLDNFLLQPVRNQLVAAHELHPQRALERTLQAQRRKVRDARRNDLAIAIRNRNRHCQRLRPQPATLALRARARAHVLHHVLAIALALGVFKVRPEIGKDPMKPRPPALACRGAVQH